MEIVESSKIKHRGQLTIPSKVRHALGMEVGTEVLIYVRGDSIVIRPKIKNPLKVFGFLGQETQIKNVEELLNYRYERVQ